MIVLFIRTLIDRPTVINFALLSSLFAPEKLYLKTVKFFGLSKIMFTCHDVIPFGSITDSVLKRRKAIFDIADYFLVHNENSRNELIDIFRISSERIVSHSFPVMDLKKMNFTFPKKKKYDFLFQGALRPEKGIDVLLEAWTLFHIKHPEAKLLIVGYTRGNEIDFSKYVGLNIFFDLKYVDDIEYCANIAYSKCIILPYKRGTNSGIPSSALSLNCEVIASDIPMFKNNSLIRKENLFKTENVEDLFRALDNVYLSLANTSESERIYYYRKSFNNEVHEMYSMLLALVN